MRQWLASALGAMAFVILTLVALTVGPPAGSAAGLTNIVTPANMVGWAFFQEQPAGTGDLVAGPASPPLGTGSAHFTVDATGRMLLLTNAYAGVRLDQITALQYSTYQDPASSASSILATSLQLDMDYDLTDGNTSWQGRLVFEPYYTQTVVKGVWQTWDTISPALELTSGNWWASGAPGSAVCPISNPCTWNEVKTAFPNAGIRASVGNVQFKAGGPWPGFDGNVDAFTIGVNGFDTTWDFELNPPPAGTPNPVGGVAGLFASGSDAPSSSSDTGSGPSVPYVGIAAGLAAAAAVVLAAGGWYARRRGLR